MENDDAASLCCWWAQTKRAGERGTREDWYEVEKKLRRGITTFL
jgi:hypothetical protein